MVSFLQIMLKFHPMFITSWESKNASRRLPDSREGEEKEILYMSWGAVPTLSHPFKITWYPISLLSLQDITALCNFSTNIIVNTSGMVYLIMGINIMVPVRDKYFAKHSHVQQYTGVHLEYTNRVVKGNLQPSLEQC